MVCPGCRRLLKLPAPGDDVPPLLAEWDPAADAGSAIAMDQGASAEHPHVRRKRKRRRHREDVPDWEAHPQASNTGRQTSHGRLAMVAGLLFLASIMAVVIVAMRTAHPDDPQAAMDLPVPERSISPVPTPLPSEHATPPRRTLNQFVNEARTVATTFLNATTVDELLEVVAQPDVLEERIRQHYPDGTVDPSGLADYSQFTQTETTDAYVIVQLHTADHIQRLMTFLEGPDGLKVDWESWVGFADFPMEDFIAQRPSGPHVFRVRLGAVDYYNFDFSDDRRWQSFRLTSPDGEHSLFGYAERGTPPHLRVREALDAQQSQVLLEVELPDGDDPTGRQVLITGVLSQNWIHPDRIANP